jgi:tetratricopeptide (TPR) repeat protein
MGEALIALGRYREAIEYLERAIACTREHQAVVILLPLHFGRLAVAHLGLGEIDVARSHAEESIRIAVEGRNTLHECNGGRPVLC